MPTEAMTAAIETTVRTLKLSTSLPTKGMETAETIMKQVAARESAERLSSRSSLIGFRSRPKAKREPLLKNSTVNPVARMTQRYSMRRNADLFTRRARRMRQG